jgi:hypothetical protein
MRPADELAGADLEIDIAQDLGPMPGPCRKSPRVSKRCPDGRSPRLWSSYAIGSLFLSLSSRSALDGGRDYCYTIAPPISVKKVTRFL